MRATYSLHLWNTGERDNLLIAKEHQQAFSDRVQMWATNRRIFGWYEFTKLTGIHVPGSNKRIRKKNAKKFMGAVIGTDLREFAEKLARGGEETK